MTDKVTISQRVFSIASDFKTIREAKKVYRGKPQTTIYDLKDVLTTVKERLLFIHSNIEFLLKDVHYTELDGDLLSQVGMVFQLFKQDLMASVRDAGHDLDSIETMEISNLINAAIDSGIAEIAKEVRRRYDLTGTLL